MRAFARLALAFLLVLGIASPALAGVAAIQATAPLEDHSEPAVRAAVKTAVETAVRGAVAMGLPWVQLRQAVVLEDIVVVHVLATDTKPDDGQKLEPGPGEKPDAKSDRPGGLDL